MSPEVPSSLPAPGDFEASVPFLMDVDVTVRRAGIWPITQNHRAPASLGIGHASFPGGFELLYHELLGCVYHASVTSEFLCNISNEAFRILGTRDRRTIARYGSPYVMTGYQPHFTLSQNLPKEDSARNDFLELIKTMRASIESSFRVEHIVLARRRIDSSYWSIADGDVFALKGAVTGPSSHV